MIYFGGDRARRLTLEQVLSVTTDLIVNFFLEQAQFNDTIFVSVVTRPFLVDTRDYCRFIEPIMTFLPSVPFFRGPTAIVV